MEAQNIDQIWDTPAPPPESVTETPAEAVAENVAPPAPDATDARSEAPAETLTPAEQDKPESPSSAEPDKPTDATKPEASEPAAKPDDDIDPKLDPATRGRLKKGNEAIREVARLAPLAEAANRIGGVPVLQDAVAMVEAVEAEDGPAFFKMLDALSPSKAETITAGMIDAALATPEWQEIAVERAFGKPFAEVKALIETPAKPAAPQPAAAQPDAPAEDEYDAEGNYITPEARRLAALESKADEKITALEKEIAEIRAGQQSEKQTAEQKAEAEQQAAKRAAIEADTSEFIGKTWGSVEAKAKAAHLFPEDGDSPEILEIKAEAAKALEDEVSKEFFDGEQTKKFASVTLDLLARGERDAAFKRLEHAQSLAEAIADRYIERYVTRIREKLEYQALKLTPTARKEVATTAAAAAPGNFAGATPPDPAHQTIDDIWAVNADATRDALARAGVSRR